ncbi:MAG: sigma-54-dependent Fis family transcriptional regulator [Devosia sp. 67-54]|uniref:sigma-54-dependent transcriptional regulator n=1 Tax=unclassified Devosia TaxID=196773 RepID=UPI00095DCBFF|nr:MULTISPECIES: sigma-54 dependent transcriptional regulator [unclassified Devosia]MBN9307515.1 sigma-54-dependent Fis family transcriptional regulator [Devosia sp.]OJX19892.1 MAG: sigma-54-dependent Fis family transcriptional regulator [Devosia sp. 67-54]
MLLSGRTIGLLEDDPIMGQSLQQRLSLEGATVNLWTNGKEAIAGLERTVPDVVVSDMRLPDMSGEDVFRTMSERKPMPPFLFITGYADIDQAVRLLRSGAAHYLAKPFEMAEFLQQLASVLPSEEHGDDEALGRSAPMKSLCRTLTRLARTRSTLLLTGETGAGKEVCATFYHQAAPDPGPFIAVNCAAIPVELMESELFGHERGAFTGAQSRHLGYAERAGAGTLFLDEIGEMPLSLQAKLLRLLDERRFHRVGGEKLVEFEARVVCATNVDLARLVRDGKFREDLLYRINVVSLEVPPLRERSEDIPWLMELFFDRAVEQFDAGLSGISPLTEEAAKAYSWPGNVRELRNRIERGVALALGTLLMPADLFPEGRGGAPVPSFVSLEAARDAAERTQIMRALEITGNEMAAAAKLLGISRTTLWEKMRRLEIRTGEHH